MTPWAKGMERTTMAMPMRANCRVAPQHAVMHAVDPARLESQSRTSTAGTLQKTQFLNCHVQKEAISNWHNIFELGSEATWLGKCTQVCQSCAIERGNSLRRGSMAHL